MSLNKKDNYYDIGANYDPFLEHSMQPEVETLFREVVEAEGSIKKLLDVGCASGRTSVFTKRLGVQELVGIEIDPRGVNTAKQHMDKVIQGDVATVQLDYPENYFDMIFFTDILEHLIDPWGQLARYVGYLAPGGFAIVSLPNVGHISVIWNLLSGILRYEESGILDNGHLRHFTQHTAVDLLHGAGLEVHRLIHRLDTNQWEEVKNTHRIAMTDGTFAIELNPELVSQELKKTYYVRKFNFLTRRPPA